MQIPICYSASNQLSLSLDQTYKMNNNLNNIQLLLNCSSIQQLYQDVFYDDICKDLFTGIYITWLSFYLSCSLLFLLSIFIWYKQSINNSINNENTNENTSTTTPLLTAAYISSNNDDDTNYIDNNNIIITSSIPSYNNQNPNNLNKYIYQNPLNSIQNPVSLSYSYSNTSLSHISNASAPLITNEDDNNYDEYFNEQHHHSNLNNNYHNITSAYENYDN